MTFGSQFQMENVSPLLVLMFQNLSYGTLKAQFGSSLIYELFFQILLGFAQIIIPKVFLTHECLRFNSLHFTNVFEYWYTFMILFHFGFLVLVAS
jgi:hypothetical protein